MSAVLCLAAGAALASLNLPDGRFTLAWTHSIEHTRWTETWAVEAGGLRLLEATVEGTGAGMEPGPGARLDGSIWRWRPDRVVPELVLPDSDFTAPMALCVGTDCARLRQRLSAPGHPVRLRAGPDCR